MITLNINGEDHEYPENTPFLEIARRYQPEYPDDIVLIRFDNILCELHKRVIRPGSIQFVTTADKPGRDTYRRTVTLLMEAAASELFTEDRIIVQHSLGQGYYCEFRKGGDIYVPADQERLGALKARMQELAAADLPISKHNVKKQQAIDYFKEMHREDKVKIFRYRRSSRVNLYEVDGYQDYYYGYMAPSTGYCRYFDLIPYQEGFMLMFPDKDTHKVADFSPSDKLFATMDEAATWGESMGVRTIGDLDDCIAEGWIQDLILVHESYMEQKIGEIAATISADPRKKVVLIAGPSSSGKTTFSHRLSIQLTAHGLRPHPISQDDFYVNREDTPRDENGDYDFECLEAVDIPLFNQCMNDLLEGKEVTLPVYNFKTGHREYRNRSLKLGEDDVLVIEGIHGLNEKLSHQIPAENKFRIYISALTQLNIDSQNNLSTTDTRLIRRMVRDARSRATTAQETLARWDSVRRGEEKNIFPFQEQADVIFNSALIYETAVLKCYAEPLLFSVPEDCPEFEEAKRLLKILEYLLPVPGENIGHNSILREFMGGGCFGL
ncbi:MAG: nucleoside kinase [Clostridiales bacterium]|nr:nucleoside kinase [Clostridiales bacterium]